MDAHGRSSRFPGYPNIVADYERTFAKLRAMKAQEAQFRADLEKQR